MFTAPSWSLLRSGFFPNADDLLFFPRGDWCDLRPWRVGGVTGTASLPRSSFLLPYFPFSSSLAVANSEKGQNPNAGR
jgi:hypothetical protein